MSLTQWIASIALGLSLADTIVLWLFLAKMGEARKR